MLAVDPDQFVADTNTSLAGRATIHQRSDEVAIPFAVLHPFDKHPEVEVLFHAGGQDMEIYFDRAQRVPQNVFDTQIAAALVGLGEQPGYADLVRRVLRKRVKKGERTTDWGRRPLSDAQIQYALDDVRYLHALRDDLQARLAKMQREEWLAEELAFYSDERTYVRDYDRLWMRVSLMVRLSSMRQTHPR